MPSVSATTGSPINIQDAGDEIYQFNNDGSITFGVGGTIEYLIIGGGGSGAAGNFSGGGGGAGSYVRSSFVAAAQQYTITVGAGGVAVSGSGVNGNPGGDSGITVGANAPGLFDGGGGGSGDGAASAAQTESSSGGAGSGGGVAAGSGGTYGNAGGGSNFEFASGGGGGAGAAGAPPAVEVNNTGGAGGNGLADAITGTSITRAGGGGGTGNKFGDNPKAVGPGGSGGGGAGGHNDGPVAATPGAPNTGSGGGGHHDFNTSGQGGSGVVILRFTPEGGGATPPTVDAGAGGSVESGSPFSLDATITAGSDPSPSIAWAVQSGVGGSFSSNSVEDPTFTPSGVGDTVLELTVTPNDGPAVTDTVTVTGTAPAQNAGFREPVYDSSNVLLPDSTVVRCWIYADEAGLDADTSLLIGNFTMTAGVIEIDSELIGSVGGTCLVLYRALGEWGVKPDVPIIDLDA